MYLIIDDYKKQCQIWVPFEEKGCYKSESVYINSVKKYEGMKYKIYEFVGGKNPTLPIFTAMLDKQIIKNMGM